MVDGAVAENGRDGAREGDAAHPASPPREAANASAAVAPLIAAATDTPHVAGAPSASACAPATAMAAAMMKRPAGPPIVLVCKKPVNPPTTAPKTAPSTADGRSHSKGYCPRFAAPGEWSAVPQVTNPIVVAAIQASDLTGVSRARRC